QRFGHAREQRLLGVLPVVVIDRIADRLDRPSQAAGNPPADFGQRPPADPRQTPCPPQDFFLFFLRQLRETTPSFHVLLVLLEEPINHRLQEPDLQPAFQKNPPSDQAAVAPAA